MDRKLADWLKEIFEIAKHPFIHNKVSARIIEQTGGEGLYHKFEIDLATAHTDKEYEFSGDRLTVESIPNAATIKLNSRKNAAIDLVNIPAVKGPFERFFLTNAASSGTLKILTGANGMFEAVKKNDIFIDNEKLYFGTGKDYAIVSDGTDLLFYDGSTIMLQHSYAANVTTTTGGGVAGDNYDIRANSIDPYGNILIRGNGQMDLISDGGFAFKDKTVLITNITYASPMAVWTGPYASGLDLKIKATVLDATPFLFFSGTNGNLQVNNDTKLSTHFDLALLGDGVLCITETSTPTADTNYGKVYCKNDNKLYFQDGAGAEHEVAFT